MKPTKDILIVDLAESAGGSTARAIDVAIESPAYNFYICTLHQLNKLYSRKTTSNIKKIRLFSFYNYPKKYSHTQILLKATSNRILLFFGKKILALIDFANEISLKTQLRFKLAGKNIDIVQANTGVHFLPYAIAKAKKADLIYYFRHWDEYGWAQGKMLDSARLYLFVGVNLMNRFLKDLKLDLKRCHVIHSPFDATERRQQEPPLLDSDAALFKDKDRKTILSIGRICPQKGQHILLEAITQLSVHCPRIKVIFVGAAGKSTTERNYERKLIDYVCANNLSDKVSFIGYRENPLKLLSFANIAVQTPTYFEALAGSLVEALQLGIATISADIGGANEAIIQNETGLLFPAGNSKALAEKIELLLTDDDLREKIAKNGQIYAINKWDKSSICTKMHNAYNGSLTSIN
ncbi:glycosyltransferase family 4 protein [Cellvibrio sp. NN19]|uniref:glycosyltransferase family 4 protein n=1 Tax=Cellvibrio chitinivorans TaxID=3102792 RepID=UPI002B40B371|nr:glycosyltransferase family 4 protein [Cellvibrio sp. NN19]